MLFRSRVVTAVVLVAVALLAFFVGRAATAVLVTVVLAAAAFELFEGFRRAGFQTATLVALLGCAAMTGARRLRDLAHSLHAAPAQLCRRETVDEALDLTRQSAAALLLRTAF